jgi:hypothetical protein
VSGFCEQDNELSLCVKAGKIVWTVEQQYVFPWKMCLI